jgi:hypothetical protein
VASGFIIFTDGRCLSVRYPIHDALLHSVVSSLEEDSPLRSWLLTQIPSNADTELGYGFVRVSDGEIVVRHLDLRALTEPNQKLFERAARRAEPTEGMYAPAEDVAYALNRFREMLDRY